MSMVVAGPAVPRETPSAAAAVASASAIATTSAASGLDRRAAMTVIARPPDLDVTVPSADRRGRPTHRQPADRGEAGDDEPERDGKPTDVLRLDGALRRERLRRAADTESGVDRVRHRRPRRVDREVVGQRRGVAVDG